VQTLGFAVVGVVVLGLALARFIDRRDSIVADRARFASHSVLRIFVALYCGWVALVAARHDDAPHIALAVAAALGMVWAIFTAGLFAWGVLRPTDSHDE